MASKLTEEQIDQLKARLDAALKRFAADNGVSTYSIEAAGTVQIDDDTLLFRATLKAEKRIPFVPFVGATGVDAADNVFNNGVSVANVFGK